jgi:hypothetical protein
VLESSARAQVPLPDVLHLPPPSSPQRDASRKCRALGPQSYALCRGLEDLPPMPTGPTSAATASNRNGLPRSKSSWAAQRAGLRSEADDEARTRDLSMGSLSSVSWLGAFRMVMRNRLGWKRLETAGRG